MDDGNVVSVGYTAPIHTNFKVINTMMTVSSEIPNIIVIIECMFSEVDEGYNYAQLNDALNACRLHEKYTFDLTEVLGIMLGEGVLCQTNGVFTLNSRPFYEE